mmetsp:Transcript_10321/g.21702  ORF Transcript_10321/g.21702 Transcript_10321/m.21702 type:complete len:343 (+) Transcript_10321:103-1131(+)
MDCVSSRRNGANAFVAVTCARLRNAGGRSAVSNSLCFGSRLQRSAALATARSKRAQRVRCQVNNSEEESENTSSDTSGDSNSSEQPKILADVEKESVVDYFGDAVNTVKDRIAEEVSGVSSVTVDVVDETSGDSTTTTASVYTERVKDLIPLLLRIAAATDRGQLCSPEQAEEAERVLNSLAAQNPTKNPVDSEMLDGTWELIYSSAKLFMTNPLLAAAATPVMRVGQVRQEIDVNGGELVTTVEVELVPRVEGIVETKAKLAVLNGERVDVKVAESTVRGGSVMGGLFDMGRVKVDVPVEDILKRTRGTVPEAYFDTIFLDKTLRVARSKAGNLYAFCKLE